MKTKFLFVFGKLEYKFVNIFFPMQDFLFFCLIFLTSYPSLSVILIEFSLISETAFIKRMEYYNIKSFKQITSVHIISISIMINIFGFFFWGFCFQLNRCFNYSAYNTYFLVHKDSSLL